MKPPFPVSPLHRCLRGLSLAPLLLVCSQAVWAVQTTPTNDFIDNGDGTVTHKTTGLMWMRCSMGQTWDGTTCTGTATSYVWATAAAFKGAYAGYNDWRLPNMPELTSIVENDNASPAINATLFPNTPTNDWYWSSSPVAYNSNYEWLVNFNYGYGNWNGKGYSYYVRLVRGGQLFGSLPLTTPSADFVDNDDGTVTHKRTNLTWMRCAVGQSWDQANAACTGTASDFTHYQAQAYSQTYAGYGDWRLPNQNELQTIIEYGKFGPALNAALFPGNGEGHYYNYYWSSNESGGSDGRGIRFDYGLTYTASRYAAYPIRMVRGSTPGSVGEDKQNIVLFLHGMNSKPATWNDAVTGYFNNCPSIYDGKIGSTARANVQKTFCYRLKFGAFDWASADMGLEDAWDYGEINGYASAGDFSTFDQLGMEISRAVNAIKNKYPNPKILLVAHSRGGLAARAFLQNTTQHRNAIVGLITTGTPHKGSRLGKIYNYIAGNMLNPDGTRNTSADSVTNWEVVDLLNGQKGCNDFIDLFKDKEFRLDPRRPVIGYLAENGPMIKKLNNNPILPAIKYGELVYKDAYLGKLTSKYNLFDESWQVDVCTQVTRRAEVAMKGGTVGAPTASSKYLGDGIVAAGSQESKISPNAWVVPKKGGILHEEEPKQTADIAQMICGLGFNWIKTCPPAAQVALAQQALAPFKPAETVSHDYDAMLADKTQMLWQDWLKVMTDDTQTNRREQLAVALGIKLRNTDNAALLADIKQHLSEPNATALERARLAQLLAEIATPSALDVLVEAYINNDWQSLKDCQSCAKAFSNAIKTVADSLPEQPRRADLSAVLEAAWLQPRLSQPQLDTLAEAIAKLGAPSGVELLLAAVEKNGAVLPSMQKKALSRTEKQAVAAFLAMGEIINPDSETVLTTAFMNHRANSAVFVSAGQGLVNLGSADAAQKVLQRVDELPANALPVGKRWLGQLAGKVDKASLRRINKAVGSPKQPVLKLQMEDMVK